MCVIVSSLHVYKDWLHRSKLIIYPDGLVRRLTTEPHSRYSWIESDWPITFAIIMLHYSTLVTPETRSKNAGNSPNQEQQPNLHGDVEH
jgi:hypothetical protein